MSLLHKTLYGARGYAGRFSGVERRILLVFVLTILASAAYMTASDRSGERAAAPGGTYTEGLVGQPQRINPLLAAANIVDLDLSRIVYSGLYKFDPNLNLIPDLAESMPEITDEGRTYTIRIRNKILWHDGVRLTADDVVYTLQAIQNPDYQSPIRSSWNRVGVEKVDENTVRLSLRQASATFIANLTLGIMPKHIWETVPAQSFALSSFNLEPVGSGPFRVTEIKRARSGQVRSIVMERHDDYHLGQPWLKGLTFKFYETTDELISAYQGRDIQGLGYVPFDQALFLNPKNDLAQFSLPLPQYQAVFINRAKNPAPLEDINVRMALAKSVDKQRMIDAIYGGQAEEAYGPVLPGHLGYHEQIPGAPMNIYDVEAAKQLLEKSGWITDPETGLRKDKQGRIITLQIATNNFSPNVQAAELLREMWQDIGIQIILNIETVSDLDEKFIRPRNYELLVFSENVGADPDPFPYWHSSQLRDPGLNLSTFNNSQADRLLADARGNVSAEDRAAKYRQFQEIFVGDAPAVFLNRSVYVYNVSKDVKGIELNTIVNQPERFTDIHKWYIKTRKK